MLLSLSYPIRNCLDVYILGLDNVTVTMDVLVCLLEVDWPLECERVHSINLYMRRFSQLHVLNNGCFEKKSTKITLTNHCYCFCCFVWLPLLFH